jgi:hypothetical protein
MGSPSRRTPAILQDIPAMMHELSMNQDSFCVGGIAPGPDIE